MQFSAVDTKLLRIRGLLPMNSALDRFFRLSTFERGTFVRAILLLPIAACAVRLVRLKTVMRWIGVLSRRERLSSERDQQEIQKQAHATRRMLEVASRYGLTRGNCLSKSLVLWHLLRREGLAANLRVGGRKEGVQFAAHAWVELDGIVINDAAGLREDFVPFGEKANGAWISNR